MATSSSSLVPGLAALVGGVVLATAGCPAGDSPEGGGTSASGGGGAGGAATGGGEAAAGAGGDLGWGGMGGAGPPVEAAVYGHSNTQLFKLDPISKQVSLVGTFDCVTITVPGLGEGMWDIAVDEQGQMMGTLARMIGLSQSGALVTIDSTSAHCTVVATGVYPNSLTFVPAGTLAPDDEVLVGFDEAVYVRIDKVTGAQSPIGNLNPNPTGQDWESSGDIVSIIDDKTYLTVKPLGSGSTYAGTDRIVEVDPVTGQVLALIGDTAYPRLWGLGYWGGTAYGFSATGQLVEIDLGDGTATLISIPNAPPGLSWWGAGVTTAAPIVPPR